MVGGVCVCVCVCGGGGGGGASAMRSACQPACHLSVHVHARRRACTHPPTPPSLARASSRACPLLQPLFRLVGAVLRVVLRLCQPGRHHRGRAARAEPRARLLCVRGEHAVLHAWRGRRSRGAHSLPRCLGRHTCCQGVPFAAPHPAPPTRPSPAQVYDSVAKRVWAARDAEGVQPLFWGVTGAVGCLAGATRGWEGASALTGSLCLHRCEALIGALRSSAGERTRQPGLRMWPPTPQRFL